MGHISTIYKDHRGIEGQYMQWLHYRSDHEEKTLANLMVNVQIHCDVAVKPKKNAAKSWIKH